LYDVNFSVKCIANKLSFSISFISSQDEMLRLKEVIDSFSPKLQEIGTNVAYEYGSHCGMSLNYFVVFEGFFAFN